MNTLPLFRFVGGKTFLKQKLEDKINFILSKKSFSRYEEWFAGGLGSFFAVCNILKENNIKDILLNDINSNLIILYKNIYNNRIEELINKYMHIENQFHLSIPIETYSLNKIKDKEIIKLNLVNARDFYKSIVKQFNISLDEFEKSYLLIFLQNHCFNGIYRENLKGEYNTPFNWEAKKIDRNRLTKKMLDIYNCFKQFNITFSSVDFELIEKSAPNTLIYLDPPYLNKDVAENKYNKNIFTFNKQVELINKIQDYSFIYSNHYDDRLIDEFCGWSSLDVVSRKNTISSSVESRKIDKKEVLITKL